MDTYTCEHCHQPFESYPRYKSDGRKRPRFCSTECRLAGMRETRECPTCGKSFTVRKSAPNVYCSRSCAARSERIEKVCPACGKTFTVSPSHAGRLYCSRACLSRARRVTYTCEVCGKVREVPASATEKRFCSDECRLSWFASHFTGENSPHWKGGEYPYYGPNWRQQRNKARHRDGHRCRICGKHRDELPEELSVHHVVPFRQFGLDRYREANALANLLTVCRTCHLAIERQGVP